MKLASGRHKRRGQPIVALETKYGKLEITPLACQERLVPPLNKFESPLQVGGSTPRGRPLGKDITSQTSSAEYRQRKATPLLGLAVIGLDSRRGTSALLVARRSLRSRGLVLFQL